MTAATAFRWSESRSAAPFPLFPGELLRDAPVGMALCNSQGVVLESNAVFQRMFGSGLGDLERLCLTDLTAPETREEVGAQFLEVISGKRLSFRFEARVGGGQEKTAECVGWHVEGRDGAGHRALIMAREADDNGFPAERWRQIQRLETLGQMAGGIAHDFNNLLTGIMLYADLLLAGLQPGSLRRYAEEIRSAATQSATLVRQLLAIGRPRKSEQRVLCVNEIAEEMKPLLDRLVGPHVTLELHLDPEVGLTKIDPDEARQLLLNLVMNARDATPPGGRIAVETNTGTFHPLIPSLHLVPGAFPCILLAVTDTGCGMDTQTRQRIFEPFFTTKDPAKGSGLGLTTVHNIVSRSGGLIHVESEPGQGTRMMIVLPRIQPASARPAGQQAENSFSESFHEAEKELIL